MLGEVTHPQHTFRIQPVDRLIQDQCLRIAQQCRSNAEPLAHAEGESAGLLLRHSCQAGHVNDLVDALGGDAVRGGHGQQVVVGAARGVHGLCIQQSTNLTQRVAVLCVGFAVDGHSAARGRVQSHDHAHGG